MFANSEGEKFRAKKKIQISVLKNVWFSNDEKSYK